MEEQKEYEIINPDGSIDHVPRSTKSLDELISTDTLTMPEVSRYLYSLVNRQRMGDTADICLAEGFSFLQRIETQFAKETDFKNTEERFYSAFRGLIDPMGEGIAAMREKRSVHSLFSTPDDYRRFKLNLDIFNREILKYLIRELMLTGDNKFTRLILYINHHGSSLYPAEVAELDELAKVQIGGVEFAANIRPSLKVKKMNPFNKTASKKKIITPNTATVLIAPSPPHY